MLNLRPPRHTPTLREPDGRSRTSRRSGAFAAPASAPYRRQVGDRRAVGRFNVALDETELGIVYSFVTTLRLRRLVDVPIDAARAAS